MDAGVSEKSKCINLGQMLQLRHIRTRNAVQFVVQCQSTGTYTTALTIFKSHARKTIVIPCKIADIHFQDMT
jgi:hypothetical protein